MKRVFGNPEIVFDALYLVSAFIIGAALLFTGDQGGVRTLAGIMALILAFGDLFHLLPRIALIITHKEERLRTVLGTGKQITSVSMTVFYLFLWHIGLRIYVLDGVGTWSYTVYILAAVRVILCLLPQNKWRERFPPVSWGIYRNIPFFLLGAAVAVLFFLHRNEVKGFGLMWLAITLSFAFYLPVTLWSNRSPKTGMFMLPKTCAYVWMLCMCLSI